MQFSVKHTDILKVKSACVIIGIFTHQQFSPALKQIDKATNQYISKLYQRGDLTGESGQTLLLHDLPNLAASRVLLVGCGEKAELGEPSYRKILAAAIMALKTAAIQEAICYLIDLPVKNRDEKWKLRQAIEIINDSFYEFSYFKSKTNLPKSSLQQLTFHLENKTRIKLAEEALKEGNAIASGMRLTKDLGNTPGNVCTPSYLANQAKALAKAYSNIKVNILEANKIKKLGMGAFSAVAQGSAEPAKLIEIHYHGKSANKKPIVLIGKGVTFDSGGISLKPAAGMDEMKYDMCGAASVLGTICAAAQLQLPIHLVGLLPATENLPDGKAVKPGDVVTTMSGQTVEILNTDAEGRLILCDALTYAEKFNPALVIDIATLTSAVIIALGAPASGLMGNNDLLISDLQKAAQESWDRVWQLPLWEEYQDLINSKVADIANISSNNEAKSIVAACFLARFAKKFPWVHLDIAGTAWKSGKDKNATGRPVPLLTQFLLNYCRTNINY